MFGKTAGGSATLAVEHITTAVASLRERGSQLSDVMETPMCWVSCGQDPDGNRFSIHQRKADIRS
jgi:predicted enzyme related to lactoylglutathione lyase